MFLGLCLFVNANRIATGTGATCPLAFFIPFLLFAFFPVSFRFALSFSFLSHETLLFFPFDVSPYEHFALTVREK